MQYVLHVAIVEVEIVALDFDCIAEATCLDSTAMNDTEDKMVMVMVSPFRKVQYGRDTSAGYRKFRNI
jgi:hypothetical protein